MSNYVRRLTRILLLPFAALLVLAGCSSTSTDTSTSSGTYSPVTIAHQYGSTTISKLPQRVISVGGGWTDTLAALDVPIVAEYQTAADSADTGTPPWAKKHGGETIKITSAADVDITKLAAFRPDIIVAGYLGNKQLYDQLSRLAPTIPVVATDAVMDTWETLTTTAGKIFGKTDKAEQLVADVNGKLADFKKKYPASQNKTFAFGTTTPTGQIGVVTNPKDPSSLLLEQLGFRLSPTVASITGAKSGRAFISPERMDVLASDLLVMWVRQGKPADLAGALPGWTNLPSVRSGAVTYLDNTTQAAFGYPSILSVPYAIGMVEPSAAKFK